MPFKKGQSGNPKGRPKGICNQKTRILEGFKEHLNLDAEKFAIEMMHDAITGGDSSVLRLLIEYLNGKPVQQTENLNINADIADLSEDEMRDRIKSIDNGDEILKLLDEGAA